MIHKIIDFSARNKFLVFLVVGVAVAAGWWSLKNIPLDAIPDLSDTQVIIYSRWDRSPDIMEDQVTYPIITALLGAPHVKDIRGFSDFGYSYVYIIFDEGTDIYWARSRTLEYLSKITPRLPSGVQTELGPDATSIGWVFQYALVDTTGKQSLDSLRSYQDWYLRYYLESVPGVAEVAPIGGLVRQYQIQVDPNQLAAYKIPLMKVVEAVRASNNDVGGRLVEFASREYMVRGRGYARSLEDLRSIVVGGDPRSGVPITVKDIGQVTLGPDIRRGIADLDGKGDAVGGVVIMRSGENALSVIDRVKMKLDQIQSSLPPGVKVVTTYDRSELILRSIDTLKHTLFEEIAIVSLVILIFLWHIPSALIPILTIPITVLIAFAPMKAIGVSSNIMSLGGIAIAIGAMVDAAIVVVEQTHKKLEIWEAEGRKRDYHTVIIEAIQEVAPASFFSLLVIAVSFMPIFALEAQEGRLFKPLAFTKNFSMAIAAVLAITLDPAMRLFFTHATEFKFRPRFLARIVNAVLVGKIHPEETHPISRVLIKLYRPVVEMAVRLRWVVIGLAIATVVLTVPVFQRLGSEFMPPLNEGTLLYMPTTLPGISLSEAQRLLQIQDRLLKTFPEVERVFGKAGRAETSTDPAPLSMVETTVLLKPQDQWRKKPQWYSARAPEWLQKILRHIWPDRISQDDLVDEMDRALRIPGTTNAWTMPIRNRVDMLTTGVRTPVGVKVLGADLNKIQQIGEEIERTLARVPGTRSVYAERVSGGYFLDFNLRRDQLARYGLTVDDVEAYIMSGVGGENVTTTVEGRERYSVNVRYLRDYRSNVGSLQRVLVATPSGAQIPISELADIRLVEGPSMIRDENGLLSGYVYVDVAGRDLGSYVEEAQRLVRGQVESHLPAGYSLSWSGQYEFLQRMRERLKLVVPITIFLVFILLYLNTRSLVKTLIVFAAVPFSAVGAIWLLHWLGYNMSIAVWVGLIALMGVDAETGVFMLLYLDLAYEHWKQAGLLTSYRGLQDAIVHGAAARVRPKVMTVGCMFMGLFPIMWSTGTGADVMKRIAAPMVGGIFTSFILELLVYPAIYAVWKWNFEVKPSLSKPHEG
ncbi:MAG: CusA/CzcA family heavy metal efflux RND transporter [Terriglobia bacterium]|jgi:Cu(I)/Ag(I) efflux system membrane protein CusA/SilA